MNVPEGDWLNAFAMTYIRKFISYKQTSLHPFKDLRVAEIFTQTFWVGRNQWKLSKLPSHEIAEATKIILKELQQLKLNMNEEQKIDAIRYIANRLRLGSATEKLAASAINRCVI